MPSALATIRGRLQIVLDDAGAAFWTTAELDSHITSALEDISHYIPLQVKAAVATSSGSRAVNISALTKRVRIFAVEYPLSQWPPAYVRYAVYLDVLTILNDPIPDGSNCNVYYGTLHTINGTDTLPEDHEQILVFGAAARACDQQQAEVSNTLATGGPGVTRDWGSLARHFRREYEKRLHPRRGVKQTRMYRPHEPTATQDSDPGP